MAINKIKRNIDSYKYFMKLDIENIKNICGELKAVTTILNTQLLISYMLKS